LLLLPKHTTAPANPGSTGAGGAGPYFSYYTGPMTLQRHCHSKTHCPGVWRMLTSCLFCLLCLFAQAAAAEESRKTDVITLYNGDRITGEIKSMEGGLLELSTDAVGTVEIEWPEIARIQSGYHYDLRLSNGDRLFGSFNTEARPGQLVLVDPFGKHEVELLQVVEIRPVEDTVLARLDIYLSAAFSYTKASSVGQLTLNTTIDYQDKQSTNSLAARSDVSRTKKSDTSSSSVSFNRNTWTENRSAMFRSLFGSYESNDELGLTSRIAGGAGVGRYWIDTHRSTLSGVAGLQVVNEDYVGAGTNQEIELFLNTSYAAWKFSSPKFDIDLDFNLYPSVTDVGRVRSTTNLRLRWELFKDLYWDVTTWVDTDNQSITGSDSDYAITTGIGWNN